MLVMGAGVVALQDRLGSAAWPQGPARVGLPSPTSPKPRPGHSPDPPGSRTHRERGQASPGTWVREPGFPVGIQEGARDGKPRVFPGAGKSGRRAGPGKSLS